MHLFAHHWWLHGMLKQFKFPNHSLFPIITFRPQRVHLWNVNSMKLDRTHSRRSPHVQIVFLVPRHTNLKRLGFQIPFRRLHIQISTNETNDIPSCISKKKPTYYSVGEEAPSTCRVVAGWSIILELPWMHKTRTNSPQRKCVRRHFHSWSMSVRHVRLVVTKCNHPNEDHKRCMLWPCKFQQQHYQQQQ